jgi:hypothetical protein
MTPILNRTPSRLQRHLLDELALCGHRPGQDERDPRPLPEPDAVRGQLAATVEALSAILTGTRLGEDVGDLLWSFVNLFHRKVDRIERTLDTNEQAQRRGQAEEDGSEVKSVELERLIAEGLSLIDAATPSNSCATMPPNSMKSRPGPSGARAPDRWSITGP